MTTLTVDADQITITDRFVVIVMDGENAGPPEQVRRLTEPCQTCDGKGQEPCGQEPEAHYNGDDCFYGCNAEFMVLCPQCRGGKPTFTLHQRCDCGGSDACLERCENGVVDLGDGWTITDVQQRDGGKFVVFAEQETP